MRSGRKRSRDEPETSRDDPERGDTESPPGGVTPNAEVLTTITVDAATVTVDDDDHTGHTTTVLEGCGYAVTTSTDAPPNTRVMVVEPDKMSKSYWCKLCNETLDHMTSFVAHVRSVHSVTCDSTAVLDSLYVSVLDITAMANECTLNAENTIITTETVYEDASLIGGGVHMPGSDTPDVMSLVEVELSYENEDTAGGVPIDVIVTPSPGGTGGASLRLAPPRKGAKLAPGFRTQFRSKKLKCPHCSYTTFMETAFHVHLSRQHATGTVETSPFKCALCGNTYEYLSGLAKHVLDSHKALSGGGETGEYYGLLTKGSRHRADPRKHHPRKYGCQLCEFRAPRVSALERHVRRHVFIYTCSVCRLRFPSSVRLLDHLCAEHVDAAAGVGEGGATGVEGVEGEGVGEEAREEAVNKLYSDCLDGSFYFNMHGSGEIQPDCAIGFLMINREEGDEDPEPPTPAAGSASPPSVKPTPSKRVRQPPRIDPDAPLEPGEAFDRCLDLQPFSRLNTDKLRELMNYYGRYECEFCGKLFATFQARSYHARCHTRQDLLKCKHCDYETTVKGNLTRHIEINHTDTVYNCHYCEYQTRDRIQMSRHTRTRHPEGRREHKCPLCGAAVATTGLLRKHFGAAHPTVPAERARELIGSPLHSANGMAKKCYKCPYCEKVFRKGRKDLQQHIWMHEGLKPYKCTLCDHGCRSERNLRAHMRKHSDTREFLCDICGLAVKSQQTLGRHRLLHLRSLDCPHCEHHAVNLGLLEMHLLTHRLPKTFHCSHCPKVYKTEGVLQVHFKKHHPGTPVEFSVQIHKQNAAYVSTGVDEQFLVDVPVAESGGAVTMATAVSDGVIEL